MRMLTALLGRKVGMTQIFGPNGTAIPVTVIEAGPCTVTQVKTEATDGYEAVQLGFGEKKMKQAKRPELGHLGHALPATPRQRRKQQQEQAKARQEARAARKETESAATETEADEAEGATTEGATAPATGKSAKRRRGAAKALGPFLALREVKVVGGDLPSVGDAVTVGIFSVGEAVDLIGTSKGKGFGGVMKRHGFHGGKRTHGQSDRARAPGSIGPGTTPGRVYKGTRMAGRMGHERVTIKALEVVQADPERNLLLIRGSIPGANGGLVMIRKGQEQLAIAARNASRRAERK
jgi:large subunit ribosomal protein L3